MSTNTSTKTSADPVGSMPRTVWFRRSDKVRDVGIALLPLILFAVLSLSTENFLSLNNLRNILSGAVPLGLIACAVTVVIIAGGFDLSAAAILAVSTVSGALVSNESGPMIGATVGILVGCLLGLVNGLLITVGGVNPFVGSIGTMIAYSGIATALAGSGLVIITDPSFASVAQSQILGIKMSSWLFILFAVICSLLLNFTLFGRHVYATGGNISAARLSGLAVNKTLVAVYVLSGGVAAVAGLLTASTSLSVSATSGSNIIWDALAAILIGGNSVMGGRGAIWRTIVGVATLSLISNGFNLLGIDPNYQQIVSGCIILIAVFIDVWTRRRL